jgi:hypothetical protein
VFRVSFLVTLEVDAQRHYANLFRWNPKIVRHEPSVIFAHRNESINILDISANERFGFAAVGFMQSFKEKVFALKRAA